MQLHQDQNKSKPCYNCVKRRIICDRSPARCRKCVKKGLTCPGYGIRYRFAHEFREGRKQATEATADADAATTAVPGPAPVAGSPASASVAASSSVEYYSGPLTWVESETVATLSQPVVRRGDDNQHAAEDAESNATTPSSESNSGSERYDELVTRSDFGTPRTIALMDAKSRWMFNYCKSPFSLL